MKAFRINSPFLAYKIRLLVSMVILCHWLNAAATTNAQLPNRPDYVSPKPTFQSAQAKRDLVRKIYTSQIGVRETSPNSGSEVKEYLRYVNLPAGNPWCAAFVCWVYGQAEVGNPRSGWSPALFGEGRVVWRRGEQGTKNKEQGLPSYVPGGYQSTSVAARSRCAYPPLSRAGGGFCTHVVPSTGDIFGLYFPEKGRIAHVGFIDEWKDPWVITVEGNTNVLGSREGDGVYRKRRLVASIYKVARYIR